MSRTAAELFDLSGRVALVTGGSRGLGREMVLAFAQAGADVVISSRKLDACEAVAEEVRALGREALPVAAHAGRWDELDALADRAYEHFGRVDVLVNNAGMSPLYESLDTLERGALRQGGRAELQGAVPAGVGGGHADGRRRRRVDHQRVEHRRRCGRTGRSCPTARPRRGSTR